MAAVVMVVSTGAFAGFADDLAEAVRRGDVARVRTLLEPDVAAAAINASEATGMTALHWAVQDDAQALAELLLEAGADPNVANRYGITPLWLAAINGSEPMTKLLLAHGADAGAKLQHGETALMAAARAGADGTIRALIAAGADPNAAEAAHGESALMWAAAENHPDAIRALVAGGADPNAHAHPLNLPAMNWVQTGMVSTVLPVGGWTALMYAARENAVEAALALAEVGADLDARDADGTTALQLAIMNAHYDLAARLLEAGAGPNVADRTGMTALYAAVDMVTLGREIGRPERPHLDEHDALDLVRLTLAHGADPNARLSGPTIPRHHGFPDRSLSEGTTALMRAAKSYDVAAMRLLLEAGADVTATQADGSSVLFGLASPPPRGVENAEGLVNEAFALVLDAGADVDATDTNGETALHRAARQGHAAAVRLLVERGVSLDVRDAAGNTPLDIVSQPGRSFNEEMAALLRRLAETR
jgi:uncharacterized protein